MAENLTDLANRLRPYLGGKKVAIYYPSWTATVTNPVIGNGTLVGNYATRGQLCKTTFYMLIGSNTTFGSGNYLFGLPKLSTGIVNQGNAVLFDSSAGVYYTRTAFLPAGFDTLTYFMTPAAAGSNVIQISPTVPFTWAVGDWMYVDIEYLIG